MFVVEVKTQDGWAFYGKANTRRLAQAVEAVAQAEMPGVVTRIRRTS